MWAGYITVALIALLFSALVVSVVWIRITRRYARLSSIKLKEYESKLSDKIKLQQDQELVIEQKTIALRELFYQVHHKGARPAMASALGLLDLYWRDSKQLSENLNLLARPNHHRYASLSLSHKGSMDEYVEKINKICTDLHATSIGSISQFEHLQ